MNQNFTDPMPFIVRVRDFLKEIGHEPSELEKHLIMYIANHQPKTNKATAVALHYDNTHPGKSPADHIDEVYAYLRETGEIPECREYYDVEEIKELIQRALKHRE